ncbi:hypothetical protein XH88_16785 [Bradyrhizobium sp. CCBAU 51627]|nr:hypothetical protein [Bradyrhizobium sp. CCBAU 51627]
MRKCPDIIRDITQLAQNEFGNIKEIARRGCKSSARNQPQTGLTFALLGRINRPAEQDWEDANDTPTAA